MEQRVSYPKKVDDEVIAVKSIHATMTTGAVCGVVERVDAGNTTPSSVVFGRAGPLAFEYTGGEIVHGCVNAREVPVQIDCEFLLT